LAYPSLPYLPTLFPLLKLELSFSQFLPYHTQIASNFPNLSFTFRSSPPSPPLPAPSPPPCHPP
jgi:hypothetical protein